MENMIDVELQPNRVPMIFHVTILQCVVWHYHEKIILGPAFLAAFLQLDPVVGNKYRQLL